MNNKWFKYIIFSALIVNAVTLGFLFFNKQKPPMPPQEVLIQALQLDDAQQEKMAALKQGDRDKRDSLKQEMSARRRALYSNFKTANPAEIDSLTAAIAMVFQKTEKSNFQHFAEIRSICRPDQQAKFDSLLLEVVRLFDKKRRAPRPQRPPQ